MTPIERAAKVAEIMKRHDMSESIGKSIGAHADRAALIAIVAELERLNAGIDRYDPYKRPECGCPHISACANVACPRRLGDAT